MSAGGSTLADGHRRAMRWIAEFYPGAVKRGRQARPRVAQIPDDELLDGRRELAYQLRHLAEGLAGPARSPIAVRASLIELAEGAEAVRELLVEVAAIGVQVGRRR